MKILKCISGKMVAFGVVVFMFLGLISCKKEKCSYYNDIMHYYDQSEEAWIFSFVVGKMIWQINCTKFSVSELPCKNSTRIVWRKSKFFVFLPL